jgi:hypothetical protein
MFNKSKFSKSSKSNKDCVSARGSSNKFVKLIKYFKFRNPDYISYFNKQRAFAKKVDLAYAKSFKKFTSAVCSSRPTRWSSYLVSKKKFADLKIGYMLKYRSVELDKIDSLMRYSNYLGHSIVKAKSLENKLKKHKKDIDLELKNDFNKELDRMVKAANIHEPSVLNA